MLTGAILRAVPLRLCALQTELGLRHQSRLYIIAYACIVLHTNLSTARTVHVVQRELNLDFSISKRLIPFSLIFSEYNAQLNCTRNNWTKLSMSWNLQIKILSLFLLRSIVKTTNLRRSVRYCFKSVILSNQSTMILLTHFLTNFE